jgi:F-type H+-transporting ATPase subunit b
MEPMTSLLCEKRNKRCGGAVRPGLAAGVALVFLVLTGAVAPGAADAASVDAQEQPAAHQAEAAQAETAGAAEAHGEEPHGEAPHGESLVAFLSRLANFGILAGGLYYLLRHPLARHFDSRSTQIRRDLVEAAALKDAASAQLAEIDARLRQLPHELDELRGRGADEIAAEEARIRQAAEADRARLLEQTDREIAMRVKAARRELVELAADLAVASATERLKHDTTDADQERLVDRYLTEVRTLHE